MRREKINLRAGLPPVRTGAGAGTVLGALRLHKAVAWADTFKKRNWPQIMGQLKDGRLLAVACVAPGKLPPVWTEGLIAQMRLNGGCAFVAADVVDVYDNVPPAVIDRAAAGPLCTAEDA